MHAGPPAAATERQSFPLRGRGRGIAQAPEGGDTRLWFESHVAADGVENV